MLLPSSAAVGEIMGYRTQPDGGAKTLAELGLTAAAQEINDAAAAVADKNEPGGVVILDGEGKVPEENLPAGGGGGAFAITDSGQATNPGPGNPYFFVATNAVTATCFIFLTQEDGSISKDVKVASRTLEGTKGFTVEGLPEVTFNWMIIEPAANLPASGGTTLTITHGEIAGFKCTVTIQSSKHARQLVTVWFSESDTTGALSPTFSNNGRSLFGWVSAGEVMLYGVTGMVQPGWKSGPYWLVTDADGKLEFELAYVPEPIPPLYVWADIGNGETVVSEAIVLVG